MGAGAGGKIQEEIYDMVLSALAVISCVHCFFFQAEDGIRDDLVTGVQTCALPILCGVGLIPVRRIKAWRGRAGANQGVHRGAQQQDQNDGSVALLGFHRRAILNENRRHKDGLGSASFRPRIDGAGRPRGPPPPLFFVTADSKALTSSVFVTAESKGLIVPQVGVSVAKFGSADYKGLTTLGGIRRTTTTSRRHYSYDTYYAWAALTCQDISVTIKVSKT